MSAETEPAPRRAKPKLGPTVSAGNIDLVVVDITKPTTGNHFLVRLYYDEYKPPKAAVKEAYVLYDGSVEDIGEHLEEAWGSSGIEYRKEAVSPSCWLYSHKGNMSQVQNVVEAMQRSFTP